MVALTVDGLESPAETEAVKQAVQILHYTLAAFVGPTGSEVIILVKVAAPDSKSLTEEETDGEWVSASAIFEFLKAKVGVSLLKPVNVASFGRMLSGISGLRKRETKHHTEYLVRRPKL